jgi:hypothetical protein
MGLYIYEGKQQPPSREQRFLSLWKLLAEHDDGLRQPESLTVSGVMQLKPVSEGCSALRAVRTIVCAQDDMRLLNLGQDQIADKSNQEAPYSLMLIEALVLPEKLYVYPPQLQV